MGYYIGQSGFACAGRTVKIQLPNLSAAIALRSSEFGPTICFCPINSSKVSGLTRSYKGAIVLADMLNKSIS